MNSLSKWFLISALVISMTLGNIGVSATQMASASSSSINGQYPVHEQLKLESVPLITDDASFSLEDNGYYEKADSVVVTSTGDVIILDREENRVLKYSNDGSSWERLFDIHALNNLIRQINENYPSYLYNQIEEISYFENNDIPYLYIVKAGTNFNGGRFDVSIYNLNTGSLASHKWDIMGYQTKPEVSIGADGIAYHGVQRNDYIAINAADLSIISSPAYEFGKFYAENLVHSLSRTAEGLYIMNTYTNDFSYTGDTSQIVVVDELAKSSLYYATQSCEETEECKYSTKEAGSYYSEIVSSPNQRYTASVTLSHDDTEDASYTPHVMLYTSLGSDYNIDIIPIEGKFTNGEIATIAIDNDMNLYIQQADVPRVIKFERDGESYHATSTSYGPEEQLTPISDYYTYGIGSNGDVYVVDQDNELLHLFTKHGVHVKSVSTNYVYELVLYNNMVLLHDNQYIYVYDASSLELIDTLTMKDALYPEGPREYNQLHVVAVENKGVVIAGTNDFYNDDEDEYIQYTNYYSYELLYNAETESITATELGSLEKAPYINDMYWDAAEQAVKSKKNQGWYEEEQGQLYTFNFEECTVTPDDIMELVSYVNGRLYQESTGYIYDISESSVTIYNRAGLHLLYVDLDVRGNHNQLTSDGLLIVDQYNGDAQAITLEGFKLADGNLKGMNPTLYEFPEMNEIGATSNLVFDDEGIATTNLSFDFPLSSDDVVNQMTIINNNNYIGLGFGDGGFVFLPFLNPSNVSFVELSTDDWQRAVVQFSHVEGWDGNVLATMQIIIDDKGSIFIQTLDIFDSEYLYQATEYGGYAGVYGSDLEFELPTALYSAVKIATVEDTGIVAAPATFQAIHITSEQQHYDVISITSPVYASVFVQDGAEEQVVLAWDASANEKLAENASEYSSSYQDVLIISADPSFNYDLIYSYTYKDPTLNSHSYNVSDLTPGLPYYFRVLEQKKVEDEYGSYRFFTSAVSELGSFKVVSSSSPGGDGGDTGGDGGDGGDTGGDGGDTGGDGGDTGGGDGGNTGGDGGNTGGDGGNTGGDGSNTGGDGGNTGSDGGNTGGDGGNTGGDGGNTGGDGGNTGGDGGNTGGDGGNTGGDGGNTGGNGGNTGGNGGGTGSLPIPNAETKPVVKLNGSELKSTITNTGLIVQANDVNTPNIEVSLNKSMWKELANKPNGYININTRGANYNLPIAALQLESVLRQLELSTDDEYEIVVSIQQKDNQRAQRLAGQRNASIIGSTISFTVNIIAKNNQTELDQFNSYVNREIELPEGLTPDEISTAVVVEENGLRHVPTKFVQNNGKWYASINSLTNSEYALLYAKVSFEDIISHWAKDVIEEMGARQIISGKTASSFDPNADVTRAEFTAMLIRALGLAELEYQGDFTDITSDRWYAGAVETATSYKLINGYTDGTFRPNDSLTREQAMVMTMRAVKLINLEMANDEQALTAYQDADQIAKYAKDSVQQLVALGIMKGRNDSQLAPQATITRAEVTKVLHNLLHVSEMID